MCGGMVVYYTAPCLHTFEQSYLSYLPTQICFTIGGEHVTCHGSKLTNSLGQTKLTNSLGKQQLELSTHTWSGCAPWNHSFVTFCNKVGRWHPYIICSIFELGGITKHLMTGPAGNSEFCFPLNLNVSNIEGLSETKFIISLGASH